MKIIETQLYYGIFKNYFCKHLSNNYPDSVQFTVFDWVRVTHLKVGFISVYVVVTVSIIKSSANINALIPLLLALSITKFHIEFGIAKFKLGEPPT